MDTKEAASAASPAEQELVSSQLCVPLSFPGVCQNNLRVKNHGLLVTSMENQCGGGWFGDVLVPEPHSRDG